MPVTGTAKAILSIDLDTIRTNHRLFLSRSGTRGAAIQADVPGPVVVRIGSALCKKRPAILSWTIRTKIDEIGSEILAYLGKRYDREYHSRDAAGAGRSQGAVYPRNEHLTNHKDVT